jgi:hypothetical protein
MFDSPVEMHYTGLDPTAVYRIRVIYGGEIMSSRKMRLIANGGYEIHPHLEISKPTETLEFDIPPAATAGGELRLAWTNQPGAGGAGRGCQIAEVWLLKK